MLSKFQLVLCLSVFSCMLYGQAKKEDLLTKREKLLNDIALTNKLIESNSKKKGNTLESLKLVNKKIGSRNKLINNYSSEIGIIEKRIADRELTISRLKVDLEKQKELYSDIIRYTYKNHNYYTKAVYLLASESFNQFYLRKKYLEQLSAARKEKIELITSIQNQIQFEVQNLNTSKKELANALLKTKQEKLNLTYERNKREVMLGKLVIEDKDLKKQLQEKKRIEEEISKRLEALIREEAKKSSFTRLTPEDQLVSNDFERNRGKLPWPTRQGIITEKFGEHYHPVIKGVKVRNNGIDISTLQESPVRSIFSGEVSKIFAIKGANYTVIIRHGNYYTVYHNLTNLKVNVGDKISTKDVLGNVGNTNNNDSAIVHFEIWKGLEKLDPELWISN
jgi:murein hydrolase activator